MAALRPSHTARGWWQRQQEPLGLLPGRNRALAPTPVPRGACVTFSYDYATSRVARAVREPAWKPVDPEDQAYWRDVLDTIAKCVTWHHVMHPNLRTDLARILAYLTHITLQSGNLASRGAKQQTRFRKVVYALASAVNVDVRDCAWSRAGLP